MRTKTSFQQLFERLVEQIFEQLKYLISTVAPNPGSFEMAIITAESHSDLLDGQSALRWAPGRRGLLLLRQSGLLNALAREITA